ncbi:MAG: universal stress protein [Chloroflexi bacterium]|nr:universal stress protein [Chloroflexota bacterium]
MGGSGSPQCEHDVRLAAILARAFGAQITLCHILSQIPLMYSSLHHMQTQLEEFLRSGDPAARQLSLARERLAGQNFTARIALREGLVRDELLALVKELHADLLIMGAHTRLPGRASSLDYYADIAEQVAQTAPISTLVVRAEPDWPAWQPR